MQLDAFLDARVRRDPGHVGRARKRRRRIPAVHDVVVHLQVLHRRPDVDPVAVVHVRDERLAALDERRKEAALDRPGRVLRDAIERIRLEDVDAGVDRIARDLVFAGLLEEPLDVAVAVRFHQPVGPRVLDRREDDRRLGLSLAVQREHRREIHVGQHVAVEDHDRFGERVAGVAHGARRAERLRLDDVAQLEAEPVTVPENLLDTAGLIVQAEDRLRLFQAPGASRSSW